MSSRPLRAVDKDDESVGPEYQEPRQEALYEFEGLPVHFATAKVSSASNLDISDKVVKIDDKVVLVLELRCDDIHHKVNQQTGKMTRVQTLRAIDAIVIDTDFETIKQSGL